MGSKGLKVESKWPVDIRSFKDSDFLIAEEIDWVQFLQWLHFPSFSTGPIKLNTTDSTLPCPDDGAEAGSRWMHAPEDPVLAVPQQTIPSGLLPRFCDTLQSEFDAWTAWMIWMWMYSGCESFCRHVHVYKTPTQKRDIGKNCSLKGIFGGSSQPPAMRMMKLPLQPDPHGGPDSWGREIFSARTLSFTDWYYRILVEIWR